MTIRNKLISFILLPLFWISYFIPKKKNLWVFGAWFGERYSDNSRYLFEYVNDNIPEISAVWLTKSKSVISDIQTRGLTSKLINSVVGYFTTARAEVVILTNGYNDVNRFGISSSVIVRLSLLVVVFVATTPAKDVELKIRTNHNVDIKYFIFAPFLSYMYIITYCITNVKFFLESLYRTIKNMTVY